MSRAALPAFFALAIAPMFSACAPAALTPAAPNVASPRSEVDAKAKIAAVLDELNDAAAHADEPRYFALYAKEAVFLGTDAAERWDLPAFRAFAHPHFAKGKAWSFASVARSIVVAEGGRFAYFDEALATPNMGPARGSGVLVLRDGSWKIAQYNLALVIPNEWMNEVKALIAKPAPRSP